MKSVERGKLRHLLGSPAAALALGLALSAALMLAPAGWSAAMKGQVAALVRPGQIGVLGLRGHGSRLVARVESHFGTAAELAEAERQRQRLVQENRRLAAELDVARSRLPRAAQASGEDSPDPLLSARCVKARVLGQQAQAFLGRHHLVDVGSEAGVEPDALVIDAPPGLIDQGRGAGIEAGQLVLSRGRVWGKVVEVGRSTSVVRAVTEPGYRDLVRLGNSGPQGILEGTGEPLPRIRLVEVTEPVAVGDPVYSMAGKGLLPNPLLVGRIARVERPVGAAHWEIWIEPAVNPNQTDQLAVLGIEINPLRLAEVSGE